MPTSISSRHFVTAVLVCHDGALWLPEVVASLSKQRHDIDQIVAVDTGSIDSSVKLLKSAGISVINGARDMGFGAAVQEALNYSKLKRAPEGFTEWIWLIHDDFAPSADALGELLNAVDERPNVAMAGPKLRGWHDRKHILEVGVSIAGNGARWTGLEYREQDQGQHDGVREVLSVSTAGALIKREVFEELEGFDPELTLFRDDVDFGWRVHTAGHSVIIVPSSLAFHAEAATNERRSIDVAGTFLHRPLLLDRRHAAYVLMANTSLWLTPFIALQLFTSSLLRALGYLIAKLPGYALDELAAVALLLLKPQELLRARRQRRKHRLVSSRVVARFIPPRSQQFQLAIERVRDAVSRAWQSSSIRKPDAQIESSVLDLNDEALENADIELVKAPSPLTSIAQRPILSSSILIFLITLLSFRNRLGDLVGGALPLVPNSGLDLLRSYADSWHSVGLGTSANMPPWIAILGIASLITFFNLKFFIALLFIGAAPLAFLGAYRLARKFTELHYLALGAALLYTFSPMTLAAVNSGRLGTVVLLIIAPWFIRSLLGLEQIENLNWRKVWTLALVLALTLAFSPLAFVTVILWQFILVLRDLFAFNKVEPEITKEIFDTRNIRRIALIVAPVVVGAPWTLEFILHPSRLFLDPGVNLAGGGVMSIVAGNPGGVGAPPLWFFSPILLISLTALFVSKTARLGEVSIFFLGVAVLAGSRQVSGHGTLQIAPIWVGSLLIIPTIAAVVAAVIMVDTYVPLISRSHIDYRHFLLGATSIMAVLSVLLSAFWWISTSNTAPLQRKEQSALPAFLSASAQTIDRYKTLVLRTDGGQIRYFIARDRDLHLGEPDVTMGLSPIVSDAITELVTGAGLNSSQVLAEFGIRYVFLARPINEDLVRTIDSVGGFSRASSTDEGISWKVEGALGHISFLSSDGQYQTLPSGRIGAEGTLATTGTIVITEKYDSRWRAILNGKRIESQQTDNGIPRFVISEPGDFIIYHDATARRGWISLQIIVLTILIVLALPARRKRSDMSEEELS